MARDIAAILSAILSDKYGREVRQDIHDGLLLLSESVGADTEAREAIQHIVSDMEDISAAVSVLSGKVDGKVSAENGKGLSECNYTTAEKDKLVGIEPGANKTIVDKDILPNSENPVQNKAIHDALQNMKEGGGMNDVGGFTGGLDAEAVVGAAVGYKAVTGNGFAGGKQAKALGFRNDGNESIVAETGAAVGEEAIAGRGFSGGYRAQVASQEGSGGAVFIDAVQLGEGTNSEPGTLQVYSHQLLDKSGRIPTDRMINTDGGFTGGAYASATFGAAVGSKAEAGKGFAGGMMAKTVDADGNKIDAIQLGTGTNRNPKTVQVYEFQLLDENGKIPAVRLPESSSGSANIAVTITDEGGVIAGTGARLENNGFSVGEEGYVGATGASIGKDANQIGGGAAVGEQAQAGMGAAVGYQAQTITGAAVGHQAKSTLGGAVGQNAEAGNGFAGGKMAKTVDGSGNKIDAIQLGTGTNSNPKTVQVYDYQLLDASGKIPAARLPVASSSSAGFIKVGDGVSVDENGVLSSKLQWKDLTNWTTAGLGAGEGYISIPANSYALFAFITTNGDVLFSSYSTADSSVLTAGAYVYKGASEKGFANIRLSYDEAIGSYGVDVCEMVPLDGSSTTPIRLKALYGIRVL